MKKVPVLIAVLVLCGQLAVNPGTVLAAQSAADLLEKGLGFFEVKNYSRALEACQQAIKLEPKNPAAHYLLGTTYYALGRYQEALGAYEKAAQLNPEAADTPDLQYEMGMTYLNLKRFREAEGAFQKVVRAEPNEPRGHFGLVGAYVGLGNTEEAEKSFKTLEKLDPATAKKLAEQLR